MANISDLIKEQYGLTPTSITNNGNGTYSWKTEYGLTNYSGTFDMNDYNKKINSANLVKDYMEAGNSSIGDMLALGKNAYKSAQQNTNNVSNILNGARNNYNELNILSKDVQNIANDMSPGINTVDAQGDNILDIASQIFGMQDGDTLAGQYVNALKAIDPDKYVSMAASDVQSSFSNAEGQMQRAMARQGMSGSGRSASLQKNWGIAMASALAGAKTKARQQGISEKLQAMSSAMEMASGLQKQGTEEKLSAIEARGKQIDALTNAGQMTQAAAEGILKSVEVYNQSYGQQLDAAKVFMEAQDNAAQYYSTQAEGLAEMYAYAYGKKGIKNII